MKPRFSAIIPTFNRAATVGRAIRSALDQRLPPCELIVLDDGSTDGTRCIAESFGPAVTYRRQVNGGVSSARNAGAALAQGEWIVYLDSDDYWLPSHLQNLAQAIEATEGAAACYFADVAMGSVESGRTYWQSCRLRVEEPFHLSLEASDWAFMPIQPMLLQASAIRRSAYFELGALPPEMKTREDTLLFYQLALRYPMCAVARPGTVMMDDGGDRLSGVFDGAHVEHKRATLQMYRRIVASGVPARHPRRAGLLALLSDAHADLAIQQVRQRHLADAARHLLAATCVAPGHFISSSASRLHRRWKARAGTANPVLGRSVDQEGG